MDEITPVDHERNRGLHFNSDPEGACVTTCHIRWVRGDPTVTSSLMKALESDVPNRCMYQKVTH